MASITSQEKQAREQRTARSLREQAADWLLTLEDGEAADREAFADWIAKSPLRIDAFLRAAAMDTLLSRMDRERTLQVEPHLDSTDGWDISPASPLPRQTVQRKGARWAAAAAVLGMLVGLSWLYARSPDNSAQQFTTAVGEQRVLELEDGSVLHLNTDSTVTIQFSAEERRVDLLSGEALFRIYPDRTRPFRVHSARSVIEAIGTQFNVHRRHDDAIVSVVEGVVQISAESKALQRSTAQVRLTAGEQVHIRNSGAVTKPVATDLGRVNAWRQRRLIFSDEPLAHIADEFNRYNRTPKFRIEGTEVGERRYAAVFDADDPESLLEVLEKDETLQVDREMDEIVIRAR